MIAGTSGEVPIARAHTPRAVPHLRERPREPARRKRAEAVRRNPELELVTRRLAERDRLLAIAARVVHLGGWTVDLADGLEYMSDEVCLIHELPPGTTLTEKQAMAFYSPESRPLLKAAFDACARDGIPYDLELELITAKGRRIAVREIGEAVRGPDGVIERVHGAFQDLSALREAEANAERMGARLERTLEDVTDAFYTLDRDWRFTYVNREAERIQRKTRVEMIGNVVWDVFPEAVGTEFDDQFRRAIATGEMVAFESYYPPLDMWLEVRAFPSEDGLAVYFLDVSAKRVAEQALAASEQRYRTLFERAGDAILIMDDSATYIDANESAAELLGVSREEIIGRSLNDFAVDAFADAAWTAFKAAGEMSGELRLRRPNGEIREAEFNAVAAISPGLHLSVLRDVTDRRNLDKQRARILAALRRLSPGEGPEETATAICAEIVDNGDFPSAAIFAFETDNGHTALGARFRDGRDVRVLGRLSDRRLGILKAKAALGPWVDDWTDPGDVSARAAMALLGVRASVFAPIESDGRLIGVLAAGGDDPASELMLRMPALVEFAALASSLLGPGLRRRSEQAAKRARIRTIISNQAFSPVFQPIVDMSSGQVLGYEALTRFDDETPPDRAFKAAAAAGIGLELEAATIEAALAAFGPLPPDCFLDVNVSPDLVMARKQLRDLLRGSGGRVVLEITEHDDVPDYVALRRAIATLGKNVRFAVDDAGAGFASMRHILELAPSHVKLDRGLITRIDEDLARQALVAGLVHFARAIDVMLIAEGVETPAERDTLIQLGIQVGQGFLFGRPAPIERTTRANDRRISPRRATPSGGSEPSPLAQAATPRNASS
jgi:PAS domain S-box-containing protein